MNKKITLFLFALSFIVCSAAETYKDYIGKEIRIAVELGDVYDKVAEKIFKPKEIPKFLNVPDMLEALRANKVDAVLISDDYIKQLIDSEIYKDFEYLLVPKDIYVNETGLTFYTTQLRDKFNEWLKTAVENGTLEEMKKRWIGVSLPKQKDIPQFELTAKNGTLKVSGSINYPPMEYLDANGKATGYQAEIVYRFAQHLGMDVEIANMTYDAVGAYIISGKADMSLSSFAITEERKQSMTFGDPISTNQIVLIVPKNILPKNNSEKLKAFTRFKDKTIGNIVGVLTYITTEKIGGKPVYYSENTGAIEDVRAGRIDGFMHALSTVRVIASQPGNENFEAIEVPPRFFSAQIAAFSNSQEELDRFNKFLEVIKADGTLADMQERWFGEGLNLDAKMPEFKNSGKNGVIKNAINSEALPYAYIGKNNEFNGFSIELALRFGEYEQKKVEFIDMEFGALIPYIISGKADISIANVAVTEERKKSVKFSNPFFDELHGVLTLKATEIDTVSQTAEKETKEEIKKENAFIAWLKTGIERNLITDNRWKMITNGLGVTMLIAISAQFFGTILGGFLCYLLLRRNKFVNWIASRYCGLINGTPVVVLLMITYYIIFGSVDISNVLVAIAAFTLVMSAIIAQTLKGSIETVDIVEIEAARSIGFSAFKAFTTVTLPQAIRRALPSYTGSFVELVKSTAIVGYIAIQDLTRAGDIIRSRTYDAYFPLILVAVIYLIVTAICVWIFKYLIKKVNGGAVL